MRITLLFALFPVAAFSSSLAIVNASFSTPTIPCASDYAFQGTGTCTSSTSPADNFNSVSGFGWTLGAGQDGLVGAWGLIQPPSFSGLPFTQAVFLDGSAATVSQSVSGFSTGTEYDLSFYLGSRFQTGGAGDGNQTVEALVNGHVVGTWVLGSSTPFTLESVLFTGSSTGSETLEFEGLTAGNHTAFLSDVSITSVPEPSSFGLLMAGVGLLTVGGVRFRCSRNQYVFASSKLDNRWTPFSTTSNTPSAPSSAILDSRSPRSLRLRSGLEPIPRSSPSSIASC